ncbi:hypothetical protein COCNU_04G005540 [Cocos nucifera]|uniref:DNA topoisomerase (ATP-hydrolyzing) n=1 Tax=Cocos nucifera TaxID=13894 RepID=A0A8K0I6F6_COCNU|nr:hypothetical protein COCNU_04G005540 [Cocos nucifera]
MALSTVLRLTSSSLARYRPPFPSLSASISFSRRGFSELRFLSTVPGRSIQVVRSKRRDGGGEVGRAKEEKQEEGSNGGLMVKEKSSARDGRIVPAELHKEATEAYMAYAMSVLLGRALPDVRDGLKPVHRRILFAMHELGLSSRKPFKKCARVVGEVLGKYHPHGDTAVYESLVRMAQDFSMRCPLIRGHGNFGSIDADPPAAMRYTECRLEALTEAMLLTDLELNTVDLVPNFDNSQREPSLLPARIPTLLLNGSSGIAVGMATNIPPHNLGELVDALSALIRNPEATALIFFSNVHKLQELLEYMPGPDFPTGGLIMGNAGILEAYRTGRGRIIVRGKTDVEVLDEKTKRTAIIIKEIPYQTNKSALVEKIAELVEDKILEGISDIRDESDRSGMRIVVELKRGSDPAIVLNNLFRLTALQSSFSCNMVGSVYSKLYLCCAIPEALLLLLVEAAVFMPWFKHDYKMTSSLVLFDLTLVFSLAVLWVFRHLMSIGFDFYAFDLLFNILDGQPKLMGLKELLQAFLDFRCSVIERRARFKLSQAQERKHIVEGIIVGLDNLDAVINIIKETSSNAMATAALAKEYGLSEKQAEAILDITLRKLTFLERKKFVDEAESLSENISKLDELLSSKKLMFQLIEQEAVELRNKFGTPRRSSLEDAGSSQLEEIDVIPNEEMLLALSEKGYVKRMKSNTFNLQHRGIINDYNIDVIFIFYFVSVQRYYSSDQGIVYSARAYRIPECTRSAAGTPLVQKVPLNAFSAIRATGIIAIQLIPGDELKWVRRCADDDLVATASQNAMVIVNSCNKLPPGHCLAAVFVVGFSLAEDGESDEQVVLVSQSGTVNRIKVRDISIQSRSARRLSID